MILSAESARLPCRAWSEIESPQATRETCPYRSLRFLPLYAHIIEDCTYGGIEIGGIPMSNTAAAFNASRAEEVEPSSWRDSMHGLLAAERGGAMAALTQCYGRYACRLCFESIDFLVRMRV